MKKNIFILLAVMLFFAFSCNTTPGTERKPAELPELVEVVEEHIDEYFDEYADEYIDEHIGRYIDELPDEDIYLAETESRLSEIELLLADTEERLADSELMLADTEERLADAEERLANLERLLAEELRKADPQPVEPPPVIAQVPQVTPPIQPPPQAPPPEAIIEEKPQEVVIPRSESRVFPPPPASGVESLTQMGMTPLDRDIIYSRIVRATAGQILEIPFNGNGWVYLGELASRRGIVYNSRRNDPEGQSFIFTLEEAGTYVLKFYRQDFIRDYILNDHVQVIVGEAPSAGAGWFGPPIDRGRVVAQPRWPSALEESQIRSGSRTTSEPVVTESPAPAQRTTPVTQGTSPAAGTPATPPPVTTPAVVTPPSVTAPSATTPPASAAIPAPPSFTETPAPESEPVIVQNGGLSADVILQRAQDAFEGGNVPAAIALLEQFMEQHPGGSDEVFWLLGQFYEANSPNRNILLSLEYYRRLVNEYPQSRRFNDARRRIAYLERFYINIQ